MRRSLKNLLAAVGLAAGLTIPNYSFAGEAEKNVSVNLRQIVGFNVYFYGDGSRDFSLNLDTDGDGTADTMYFYNVLEFGGYNVPAETGKEYTVSDNLLGQKPYALSIDANRNHILDDGEYFLLDKKPSAKDLEEFKNKIKENLGKKI